MGRRAGRKDYMPCVAYRHGINMPLGLGPARESFNCRSMCEILVETHDAIVRTIGRMANASAPTRTNSNRVCVATSLSPWFQIVAVVIDSAVQSPPITCPVCVTGAQLVVCVGELKQIKSDRIHSAGSQDVYARHRIGAPILS
jgi:hypothetical protein